MVDAMDTMVGLPRASLADRQQLTLSSQLIMGIEVKKPSYYHARAVLTRSIGLVLGGGEPDRVYRFQHDDDG
jgi:hypothetical protein